MAKLIIYEDATNEDTIIEVFDLMHNRILIGSSADNQLVLDAPDIDPAHASLELRHGHWVLQDLGSPGGTMVNGQTIEGPYYLQHDDLIELRSVKLKFQNIEEVEPELPQIILPRKEVTPHPGESISGRLWFATIAGGTIAAIFIILLLLIIADYLGLLHLADLLPPWLGH